jgi:hypothetical protein
MPAHAPAPPKLDTPLAVAIDEVDKTYPSGVRAIERVSLSIH